MATATVLAALAALAGLASLWLALRRLRARRPVAACVHGLGGGGWLAVAVAIAAIGANLLTYQRLTFEQPVARIGFQRLGPERYRARLELAGAAHPRVLELRGDEWELDARVLKWRGLGNLLGLDARYRLERLSGRYSDVERERTAPRTVYALAPSQGLDLWRVARRYGAWIPLVDAVYGSGAYLPMTDGGRFEVRLSQSGLVARPSNAAAGRAVSTWR